MRWPTRVADNAIGEIGALSWKSLAIDFAPHAELGLLDAVGSSNLEWSGRHYTESVCKSENLERPLETASSM